MRKSKPNHKKINKGKNEEKEIQIEKKKFNLQFQNLATIHHDKKDYRYLPKSSIINLQRLIKANWDIFTFHHVCYLLKVLSQIQERDSKYLIESITNLALKRLSEFILMPRSVAELKCTTMAAIFYLLPKLCICHQDYLSLYKRLTKHTCLLFEVKEFKPESCATILNAMVRLRLDLLENATLVKCLLKPFLRESSFILNLSNKYLVRLWEFLAYTRCKHESKAIEGLYDIANLLLNQRDIKKGTPSGIQYKVYQELRYQLPEQHRHELRMEYLVGPYALDIALIQQGINVEVDGSHHQRFGSLRLADELRDYILTQNFKWRIVRVPLSDFFFFKKNDKLSQAYLSEKLSQVNYQFTKPLGLPRP